LSRRQSFSVSAGVPSTPAGRHRDSTALPVSPLLFALKSLHGDFDLLLHTFDTFNLLTNPNKLWYKLQNYCFLHKSNLGALVCALYWQMYGPPIVAPVQLPQHLSVPTQLKPLSITAILLRECTALTSILGGRDFTSFASRGSLGGGPSLQYHLSQTYQHLLLIRDQINLILMAHSGAPGPSSPSSHGSGYPHNATPLSSRSKDLVKLEWNFLQTLIHTTLLLWSLEVRDVDALMTILDSSFANSNIKHPRMTAQSVLAPVKLDTASPLARKVQHITRNEIPFSNGFEWRVQFMLVSFPTPNSIKKFQCTYYNSYANCLKVIKLLQSARGDADIGYARSGTALRVGFLERDAPHEFVPAFPHSNRVLWIEEAASSDSAASHTSMADDYLANPALLKKQAAAASAAAAGGARADADLEEPVKASFAEMIQCIAVHRVLASFQNNLKQTQLSQMDSASMASVGAPAPPSSQSAGRGSVGSYSAGEAELKNEIFEAFLALNVSLSAQLATLNASINAQFTRAVRQLVSSKLEFEFTEQEEAHEGPELMKHTSTKAARVYPLQEVVDSAFVVGGSPDGMLNGPATPALSMATLLHSLHLAEPLKLLGQELVRLFTVEGVMVPGAREIPFTGLPLDIYRRGGHGSGVGGGSSSSTKGVAIPQALAVNPADPRMLAIATSQGIREINVEHAIKYRRRRDHQLEDDEEASFSAALHRFDAVAPGAQQAATGAVPSSREPMSPPSRAMDSASQLLNLCFTTPAVTTLAYPAPKAILAAMLGGLLSPGVQSSTGPANLFVTGKAAALLGLVPVSSSHASSSFLQGGLARVYEDFVAAAPQRPELPGPASQMVHERDAPATHLTAHPSLPMCQYLLRAMWTARPIRCVTLEN
jgi:hypothetical protein